VQAVDADQHDALDAVVVVVKIVVLGDSGAC